MTGAYPATAASRSRGASLSGLSTAALAFGVWAIGALYFFRDFVFSGFTRIIGNNADTRFIAFLHEHWYRVWLGENGWRSPPMFFPVEGTLGYSDGFLLNQLAYVPLRALGLEPLAAFETTFIVLSAVGFFGAYAFLTRTVHATPGTALAGAAIFAFSNNLFLSAVHPQLYGIYYLPPIFLGAAAVVQALASHGRMPRAGLPLAFLVGLSVPLLLLTSFYIGFYVLLAGLVFSIAALLLAPEFRTLLCARWRRAAALAGAAALGFVVGMVPFLVAHYPVLSEFGGRPYREALAYATVPAKLILPEAENIWAFVFRFLPGVDPERMGSGEIGISCPPFLTLSALAALWFSLRHGARRDALTPVFQAMIVTAVILSLLSVKIGTFSLWYLIHHAVPGASGVRAILRIHLMAGCLLALSIPFILRTCLADAPVRRLGPSARSALAAAFLSALVVEQINLGRNSEVDRRATEAFLASVPHPGDCPSFYIETPRSPIMTTPRSPNMGWAEVQVDAILLAHHLSLPTFNGLSGQVPAGWNLYDPTKPDHAASVRAWMAQNGLARSCALNAREKTWRPIALDALR